MAKDIAGSSEQGGAMEKLGLGPETRLTGRIARATAQSERREDGFWKMIFLLSESNVWHRESSSEDELLVVLGWN